MVRDYVFALTEVGQRRLGGLTVMAMLASLQACAPVVTRYAARSAAADSAVKAAISRERAIQAADIPSNTVGVLPLRVVSADTSYASLGYGLAALMAGDLARTNRLVVVERLRLDAVLRELDLVKQGRVDAATGPRAGRLVGARRVIVGDLAIQSTGTLQLASRIANAATGVVDGAFTGSSTVRQIFDIEKTMVLRILEVLGVTLTPAERRAMERRPTQNLGALVAFSNGVRAEAGRDLERAVTYYEAAARLDPAFVEARDRSSTIRAGASASGGALPRVNRASSLSNDLVNRLSPVIFGSGVDAPLSRQQTITITIGIITP
jgi:TolB-like protein